jgi:hypothetical protein
MAKPSDRGSKLRDTFTRQREMPDVLQPFVDDLFHPLSERNRRLSHAAAKFGLVLLAYGLVLFGVGWVVFSLFWPR